MRPTRTWIFVGDGKKARIFLNKGPGKGLEPAIGNDFALPQMRTSELGTERPSTHAGAGGGGRHGVAVHADWHEQEKEEFARDLARYLEDAAKGKEFDRLILVAPPRFLGALREHLGDHAKDLVSAEIDKDLTHLGVEDLPPHLGDYLAV